MNGTKHGTEAAGRVSLVLSYGRRASHARSKGDGNDPWTRCE